MLLLLSRRDKPIFGAILLPAFLVILYLATRTPPSSYPIAKITLTILPFVIGLVFVALSRVAAINPGHAIGVLMKLLCAVIVAGAAAGSVRYYSEVLNNEGLLRYVREPHFLNVCRELEEIKNKRVLLFENDPLLTRGSATTLATTTFTLTAGLSATHPSLRLLRSQRYQISQTSTLWPPATGLLI